MVRHERQSPDNVRYHECWRSETSTIYHMGKTGKDGGRESLKRRHRRPM